MKNPVRPDLSFPPGKEPVEGPEPLSSLSEEPAGPDPVRPDLSFPPRKEPAAGPSATAGSGRIEGRTGPPASPSPLTLGASGHQPGAPSDQLRARAEETSPAAKPLALGVDIARYGADATAFSWIVDGRLTRQTQYHGASLTETTGRIADALKRRPDLAVALDDTGIGGGVTDRLRELGWEPLAVNFGAAAADREHYTNRGSELYQRLHDALFAQLLAVSYRIASDGRRQVRKRGPHDRGPSPDLADSLALAWAAYEEGLAGAGVW